MNYKKIYDSLITRAQTRDIKEYAEWHHIIPRCMGGRDDETNLVRLTPEEHYIAHQLLVKVYPNNERLVYAAIMMRPSRPTNKLYGWLKRRYAKIRSVSQTGKGNNMAGTAWVSDMQLKKSFRIRKGDIIPAGCVAGRNKWKEIESTCAVCGCQFARNKSTRFCSLKCKEQKFSENNKARMYKNGYSVEVDGVHFESISKAADSYGIGHETARMRFKSKNFPTWKIVNNLSVG